MKIYSLVINDEINKIYPVYECHSWERAEEIIKSTTELLKERVAKGETNGESFSFEVHGFVKVGE